MIRSVSLDLGGTLLTEVPSRFAIYAEEARRAGADDVSAARMKSLMRRVHARMPEVWNDSYRYDDRWFERFIIEVFAVELNCPQAAAEAASERLFARFEARETFRLFDGVHALLDGIRRLDLTVGVLSNWSARLPRVLTAVGLGDAFDWVVCSARDRVEKPDAAAFLFAAQRAGVAPDELLHAGDRLDLDGAAVRAGCGFVHVTHADVPLARVDAAKREVAVDGVPAVDSLPELLAWIRSHLA